jgi:hypothetical protein
MKLHVIRLTDSHGLEHTWWWLYADAEQNEDALPSGVTFELWDQDARGIVAGMTFHDWLLGQADRRDAAGRLARDVASEERRLARSLTMLNNRCNLLLYVLQMPAMAAVTRTEALNIFAEYLDQRRAVCV